MKLKYLEISNFKSIEHQSIYITDFNILVGKNNHGKTNILDAIDFLYNGCKLKHKDLSHHSQKQDIIVMAKFDDVERFIPLGPTTKQAAFKQNLNEGELTIKRVFKVDANSPSDIVIIPPTETEEGKNPQGIDNALRTILPKLEYMQVANTLDEMAKVQKSNYLGKMIYDIFTKITPESDHEYNTHWQALNRYFNAETQSRTGALQNLGIIEDKLYQNLSRKFPECEQVKFGATFPSFEDVVKGFKIRIKDDGFECDAFEKGEGMQRGLAFSLIEAYAEYQKERIGSDDKKDNARNQLKKELPILFLIDEAELHLHPSAQKDVKKALMTLCERGDQVILTTHSHILAKNIPNTAPLYTSKILQIYKTKGKSVAEDVDESRLFNIVFDLLGADPTDLLFPNNIAIVEGISDSIFLSHCMSLLMKKNRVNDKRIIFHFCEGDSRARTSSVSVDEMLKTAHYNPIYREKLGVLLDNHVQNDVIKEIKKFLGDTRGVRVKKHSKHAIEYFYPQEIVRKVCSLNPSDNVEPLISRFLQQYSSTQNIGTIGGFSGSKKDFAKAINSKLTDISLVDSEIVDWLKIMLQKAY